MNYLIDAYTIFAASVLAANAVLRSLFGFAFPLFTSQMYENLGIHWAASIPAFLALMCVPMPFILWKYGAQIRERCAYAKQAAEFMRKMQSGADDEESSEEEGTVSSEDAVDKEKERQEEREEEQEAIDYSYEPESEQPRLEPIKSMASRPGLSRSQKSYDTSPFDLDRTNTNTSFRWERQRTTPSRRGSQASKTSKK